MAGRTDFFALHSPLTPQGFPVLLCPVVLPVPRRPARIPVRGVISTPARHREDNRAKQDGETQGQRWGVRGL
uniref:hypothetical protein n=1 Tax=Eisenbergiella tayi TaxID=1432052 RepID=UPI003FEF7910